MSLLRISKRFNPSKIAFAGYTKLSGFGMIDSVICLLISKARKSGKFAAPHEARPVAKNRRTRLMRFAWLFIFLAVAYGGTIESRSSTSGPTRFGTAGARSAASLYARNCASCHGRDGRAKTAKGRSKHARDLADSEWQQRVGDERIFNSVMNGKGKMPAYGKILSEQEIDSLIAYVRGLKK